MNFLVTTTERCGSTWVTRMLEAMTATECKYLNSMSMGFDQFVTPPRRAPDRLRQHMAARPGTRVFKTHNIPSNVFDLLCSSCEPLKIITISREIKDVIISRYFYYRYYWPTQPALGAYPTRYLRKFFPSVGEHTDREALARLMADPLLEDWIQDWAAFEGPFKSRNAIRLNYADLVNGSDISRLEQFAGCKLPEMPSFQTFQQSETDDKGRSGHERFNRAGREGQWREWFTSEQCEVIDQRARLPVKIPSAKRLMRWLGTRVVRRYRPEG